MFIQIKNYYVTAIYTDSKGGFNADIEKADGKHFTLNYSRITDRFYKDGNKAKLPQYLCKEALNLAISGGIVRMSDIERENAMYWVKNQ